MKKLEFATAMKHLSIAFNKDYTQEDLEVYYEYFKEYEFDILKNAVKEIIKKEKFVQAISDLVKYCEKIKKIKNFEIINYMIQNKKFKDGTEISKAIHFVEEGIIPEWFRKEMDKYLPRVETKELFLKDFKED